MPSVVWEHVTPGFECDSPGARPAEIVPFGAFTFGGRAFIVAETLGYEMSERRLFEVTRGTVRSAY